MALPARTINSAPAFAIRVCPGLRVTTSMPSLAAAPPVEDPVPLPVPGVGIVVVEPLPAAPPSAF
ncbi:hypothetical protein D3C71_2090360 [compost metagenome]